MASASALSDSFLWGTLDAEDLLVCALCSKFFNDPRVLKCDHSFCRPCLQAYFDKRQAMYATRIATLPCPTCQHRVHLPLMGISGLPIDGRIKRAKEVFISELMEDVKHRPEPPPRPEPQPQQQPVLDPKKDSIASKDSPKSPQEDTTPVAPPRKKRGRSQTRRTDALPNGSNTVKSKPDRKSSLSPGQYSISGLSPPKDCPPPREPSPFTVVRDPIWNDFSPPPRDFECTTPKPSTRDPTWGQFNRRRSSTSPKSPKSPKHSPFRSFRVEGEEVEAKDPPFSPPTVQRDESWNSFSHTEDHNSVEKKSKPTEPAESPEKDCHKPSLSETEDDFPPSPLRSPPPSTASPLPRSSTEPDLAFNSTKPKLRDKSHLQARDKERPRSHASLLEPHMENFSFTGLKRSNSDRLRSRRTQELEDDIHNIKDGQVPPTTTRSSRFIRKNSRRYKANRNDEGKADTQAYNGKSDAYTRYRSESLNRANSLRATHSPFSSPSDSTLQSDNSGTSTPQSTLSHHSSYDHFPSANHAESSHYPMNETQHDGFCVSANHRQTPTRKGRFSNKRPDGPTFEEEFAANMGGKTFSEHKDSYQFSSTPKNPKERSSRSEIPSSKFSSRHTESNTDLIYSKPKSPSLDTSHLSKASKEARSDMHGEEDEGEETKDEGEEANQPYQPKLSRKKTQFVADTNNNDGMFSSPYSKSTPKKRWSMPAYTQMNSPLIDKYLQDSDEEEKSDDQTTKGTTLDDIDGSGLTSQIVIEEETKEREKGKSVGEDIFRMVKDGEMEVIRKRKESDEDVADNVGKSSSTCEQDYEIGELTIEVETETMRLEDDVIEEENEGEEDEEEEIEPDTEEEEDSPEPVYAPSELQWSVERMDNEQPTSMAVLKNGKAVVADYNHNQLLFYDQEGEFEFQLDGMKPYSLAVNHSGHVLVGDRKNKTVKSFDEYGTDLNQWPDDILDWVAGIAVLSDDTIVVLDRQYCKIKLFSPEGEHRSEFGSYGTREQQLAMADFITVDSKDRIIVCDSGNHCVKIFDREGKFLLRFGCRGRLKGELQWPKGICVDNKDNIIVADMRNNRVCMFTPDGEYIQRVVKKIANPYAVSFTEPNQLGVTQFAKNGESEFRVFKLNEKMEELSLDDAL